MKAKIDKNGFLTLDRGVKVENWQATVCPFAANIQGQDYTSCGDWCPHFHTSDNGLTVRISICHGKNISVWIDDFVDERP